MKKIVRRSVPEVAELHTNRLLHSIYAARGICCVDELSLNLQELLDFRTLQGIEGAVELLAGALFNKERVIIVGDYDTDGATSTALSVLVLRALGFTQVTYLIPNRFEFGYGLSPEIVKLAQAQEPALLMTVDNGIASIAGVKAAKELGIKVLITDHHLAGNELPEADAIVNPKQPGDQFPSKNLAGVGVIFYVMLALRSYLRERDWFAAQGRAMPNMLQFLDLVALGTVADVVTLDKNNRILVEHGLQRIRRGVCRPGIKALLSVANKNYSHVSASDLGFIVAPRINAAGRLDDISLGIECLLTESRDKAQAMAYQLHALNNERRAIELEMHGQATRIVERLRAAANLPLGLCLFEEDWHQGVLGIIAARIKDCLHRPVIAFAAVNDYEIKGSARSIPGFHMRDILNTIAIAYPELITKFGGHALAAGLTVARENYAAFNEAFITTIAKLAQTQSLQCCIYSDGELSVDDFSLTMVELLDQAGPWGAGFPEPKFDGIFTIEEKRILAGKHWKLVLRVPATKVKVDAIYFNAQEVQSDRSQAAQFVYRLAKNEYNGKQRLQLIIEHCEFK